MGFFTEKLFEIHKYLCVKLDIFSESLWKENNYEVFGIKLEHKNVVLDCQNVKEYSKNEFILAAVVKKVETLNVFLY